MTRKRIAWTMPKNALKALTSRPRRRVRHFVWRQRRMKNSLWKPYSVKYSPEADPDALTWGISLMLPFQGMLHHSAPERSLSLPFSGLWFLFLDCWNVSRTRPGASGDVSSPGCRRDVAGMSPGCRLDVVWRSSCGMLRKKIPDTRFFFVFSPKVNILRSN